MPLMMPAIHSMRLAVSPSRSALMIGMPPATAASNATITPAFVRRGEDLVAVRASSALLAVTTCLPLAIASQDERSRRLDAADQLDDDVDVGMRDHRSRIRR